MQQEKKILPSLIGCLSLSESLSKQLVLDLNLIAFELLFGISPVFAQEWISGYGNVSDLHFIGLNRQSNFVPIHEQPNHNIVHLNRLGETKSIFSVVREYDSVFAHKTPSYDGKDELN